MYLIVFFFLGLMLPSAYAKSADGELPLLGSPWFEKCPKENERAIKNCVIERSIYVGNESRSRLATISIEILKGNREALLRFLVPLETLLPMGLTFELAEENTFKGFFLFCDVNGCYSQIKLNQGELQNFINTNSFVITYSNLKSANKNNEVRLAIDAGDLSVKIKELLKKPSK